MNKKEILDEIEKDILENKDKEQSKPEVLEEKPDEMASNKKFVDEETGEILEDTVPAEVEIKKDDEENKPKLITIDQIKGVGTTTVKKLQEIGIDNIAD